MFPNLAARGIHTSTTSKVFIFVFVKFQIIQFWTSKEDVLYYVLSTNSLTLHIYLNSLFKQSEIRLLLMCVLLFIFDCSINFNFINLVQR
jgi:hypothetical protein